MTLRSKGGIAYEERGDGSGIPFIALHGHSLDRRMSVGAFEPLFAARDEGAARGGRHYRRIYPDLPFMGESTDEPRGAGHDGILAALCDFICGVCPGGTILLGGESYGGYLARGIARELGGRVGGLFFLCPAIVARRDSRDLPGACAAREESGWRDAAIAAGASDRDLADYEALAVVESAEHFRRFSSEVLVGIRVARLQAMDRYCAGSAAFSFDRMDAAGEPFDPLFGKPACFFLGRQDSSVGWRDALRLAERYPRASYHILDGAGHNAQIEAPEAFAAAFKAWIAACEATNTERPSP